MTSQRRGVLSIHYGSRFGTTHLRRHSRSGPAAKPTGAELRDGWLGGRANCTSLTYTLAAAGSPVGPTSPQLPFERSPPLSLPPPFLLSSFPIYSLPPSLVSPPPPSPFSPSSPPFPPPPARTRPPSLPFSPGHLLFRLVSPPRVFDCCSAISPARRGRQYKTNMTISSIHDDTMPSACHRPIFSSLFSSVWLFFHRVLSVRDRRSPANSAVFLYGGFLGPSKPLLVWSSSPTCDGAHAASTIRLTHLTWVFSRWSMARFTYTRCSA